MDNELAFLCQCCGEVEVLKGDKYILRASGEKQSLECFKESGYTDKYDDYGVFTEN